MLLQALRAADELTGSKVRLHLRTRRLETLVSPLLDLLSERRQRERALAYQLLFRAVLFRPSAAPLLADKLIECLLSDDEVCTCVAIPPPHLNPADAAAPGTATDTCPTP